MAEEIKASLKDEVLELGKSAGRRIRLAVAQVRSDTVTEKFLAEKKKFGSAVGIDLRIYNIEESISTNQLRKKLAEIVHIKENTGVIVQLPLPKQINTQYILDGIISEKDPDMLSSKSIGLFSTGRSKILPPVVGAIKLILEKNSIELCGRRATVLGAGRLVGKPVATWLINEGAAVTVIDEHTTDPTLHTINADILISGIGAPNLIKPSMVKDGVVAIDCGTSVAGDEIASRDEMRSRLIGDIDPAVAEKAALFTPVPGGVGPLTVAMLFKNLMELAKAKP